VSTGADPYRLSRRSTFTLVGLFLAIAAAAVLSMVGLPYVVRQPGPIVNTLGDLDGKPLITVRGAGSRPIPPTRPAKTGLVSAVPAAAAARAAAGCALPSAREHPAVEVGGRWVVVLSGREDVEPALVAPRGEHP
jgi:hypothetical protein